MADPVPQLSLPPDLGIEHVAELRELLMPHFDVDEPLSLAGDQVRRVHAAGLQLLHAFVRDRSRAGRTTAVTSASPVLRDAARLLALDASLGTDTASAQPHASNSGEPA